MYLISFVEANCSRVPQVPIIAQTYNAEMPYPCVAEAQSKTYKMNTAFDNAIKGWIGGVKLSVKNLDNGKTLGSKNFSSAYINSLEENPAVTFSFKAKGSADEDWLRVCVDQGVGTGHACAYRDFSPNKEGYHLDID
jgi:hypothetical protein